MKHNLVIKDRPSDYLQGVSSPIPFKAVSDGTWNVWFNEDQRNQNFDNDGCACYSGNKVTIDPQMDVLLATFPDSVLTSLRTMGFMDTGLDGKLHFHSSPRFTEIMTGNGVNGNSMPDVFDAMRKYGTVPWTMMPFTETMAEHEYFNPTNLAAAKVLGQQFLSLMGGKNFLQYHWITKGGKKDIAKIKQALLQSPLGFGIAVTDGWNQEVPTVPPANQPVAHAVGCNKTVALSCGISDNYIPYDKLLDPTYPIPYIIQAVITPVFQVAQQVTTVVQEAEQVIPQVPVAQQQTLIDAIKTLLTTFVLWLQK